ncbi:MAG: thioredoxin [Clostridia bacterium]|nr:thioredoxin [Clostridia bacterium]
MEIEITKENFQQEIINSHIPVLLDFRASWCQPCAMLAPVLTQVAEKYEGKIKVCKVNIDNEIAITMEYNITSVPTLVIIAQGEEKARTVGLMSFDELEEFILSNI